MSPLSDEKLIESCIAGNREHYRLLYERYKDYVAGLVWRLASDGEVVRGGMGDGHGGRVFIY